MSRVNSSYFTSRITKYKIKDIEHRMEYTFVDMWNLEIRRSSIMIKSVKFTLFTLLFST